jgi:hypothetical protein
VPRVPGRHPALSAGFFSTIRASGIGRAVLALALVTLWLALTSVASNLLLGRLESEYPPTPLVALPHADAAIVLGGSIPKPAKESHEQDCDKNDRRRVPQFSLRVEAKALRFNSDFTMAASCHGRFRKSLAGPLTPKSGPPKSRCPTEPEELPTMHEADGPDGPSRAAPQFARRRWPPA